MHAIYIYIYTQCCWKVSAGTECSIFLHKYDSKHHDQVLKVDIENPIKQWDKNIFFVNYLFRKWSSVMYLCVAKVCDSLGLAVHLKSICAEVFSVRVIYQMSVRGLFYSKNRDLSKSDHVCGSESCQEQRRSLKTSEKELMLLIGLETFTKPSLKSLTPQIQSQTDCVQMKNSRPLLPSREVLDQQRSLQSRTCNSLRGYTRSQGDF